MGLSQWYRSTRYWCRRPHLSRSLECLPCCNVYVVWWNYTRAPQIQPGTNQVNRDCTKREISIYLQSCTIPPVYRLPSSYLILTQINHYQHHRLSRYCKTVMHNLLSLVIMSNLAPCFEHVSYINIAMLHVNHLTYYLVMETGDDGEDDESGRSIILL